jgi:ABC-type transporter Mla maintaining outer membrane lipid asymmetry permease subunit MlaE
LIRYIEDVGRTVMVFSEELGRIILLLIETVKQAASLPFETKNTFSQMYETGVRSLPVVVVTAVSDLYGI